MPAISRKATVQAVAQQVSCNLGQEAVILELKNGVYYGLNEVGAAVWELVQKPRTVGEIVEALTREYEVEAGSCERDLQALLRDLARSGLVEIRDEKPA